MRFRFLCFLFLVGCSSGSGLQGCDSEESEPFVRNSSNLVEDAIHTVITSQGVQFAYDNRTALVSQLLAVDETGWAEFEVPPFEAGDDRFGVRGRDISVGLHIPSAQLDFEILPNPLRIRLDISDARMRINDGIVGLSIIADGACRVENGLNPGTNNASFAVANLSVLLTPSIDEAGKIQVEVTLREISMSEFSIELEYDETLPECRMEECEFVCSLSRLGAELTESLYDSFRSEISTVLAPVMSSLINERLSAVSDQSLKIEGLLKPDSLSENLPLPDDAHPLQFLVAPSADGLVYVDGQGENPGLGLTIDVGTESVGHPCVPRVVGEPSFPVGPAPTLTGFDALGDPYHIGVSIAESTINRALWSAWRAGFLCFKLDSDTIEDSSDRRVDTDTLGIFLPSLSVLTRTARPVIVVLDPKFSKANFPVLEFISVPDDRGTPQAGMSVQMPNLGIDMYAYLEGRWTRLTSVRVDVDLSLVVQATPMNELSLAGETPTISNLVIEYNELLEADDLDSLLQALIDLTLGSFLTDGLNFSFGFQGLLSSLVNVPYDARITSIVTAGQAYDHLSIFFSFERIMAENGLTIGVDTKASLRRLSRDAVELDVAAPGAVDPVYQYRIQDGPWRPLRGAKNGRITIREPMLKFAQEQTLLIRAAQRGLYRSLDETPAEVRIPSARARDHAQLKLLSSESGGCSTTATTSSPITVFLSVLCCFALLGRARRWSMLLALLIAIFGCEDSQPAPDIPCTDDVQCPAGLICLGNICLPERACSDDSECCVLQSCQGGVCRSLPPDACNDRNCPAGQACTGDYCVSSVCDGDNDCANGGSCVEGACIFGSPCRGSCSADEACFVHRRLCRKAPSQCDQTCPDGTVRVVVNPRQYDGPVCNFAEAECRCVESLGNELGSTARQADMALLNGRPIFASFDPNFEDLVLIEDADTENPIHTYLDGLPGSENAVIEPSTSRLGLTQPGPKRGYFPQIEVDNRNRVHIAYYALDQQALRYMRREEDGTWIGPIVIDEGGDAGHYVQLRVDQDGRSHLIYSALGGPGGQASIRYTVGSNVAIATQNFEVHTLSSRPTNDSEIAEFGILPREYGVKPCMTLDGDRVVVAFHDAVEGKLFIAAGDQSGFQIEPLRGDLAELGSLDPGGRYSDFSDHRVGEHCAVLSREGNIELFFTNERTWALMGYRGSLDGQGVVNIVDAGQWGGRQYIGAAPTAMYDPVGRPVVVYQDATNNDLRLNVRTNAGWLESATVISDQGALGFSNSVAITGSNAIIGTVQISTAAGARETSGVQVYSIDLTQY